MRYLRLFEKIDVDKFNQDLADEWEDNEPEEDDDIHVDKLVDLKGGKVYRASIVMEVTGGNRYYGGTSKGPLTLTSAKGILGFYNGKFQNQNYYGGNQYTSYGGYGYDAYGNNSPYGYNQSRYNTQQNRPTVGNMDIVIQELIINNVTPDGKLSMILGRKKYSMKISGYLKREGRLKSYYVRQNDVIAFNKDGLRKGLLRMYRNNGKFFAGLKDFTAKIDLKPQYKQLVDLKTKQTELQYLLDNYDKLTKQFSAVKNYIRLDVLKQDLRRMDQNVKVQEDNINTIEKINKGMKDSGNPVEGLLQKIEKIGD